eukprot:1160608-Pelagomonas_calceolata.AAC.2
MASECSVLWFCACVSTQAMKAMSGEWVELDNGCLCCSVKNDFVQALESLMRKKQKPQAIVIETTGVCVCVPAVVPRAAL